MPSMSLGTKASRRVSSLHDSGNPHLFYEQGPSKLNKESHRLPAKHT